MAKVNISGTVAGVHKERIVSLWETFDVQGRVAYRKWTIWFDQSPDLEKDDWIEVTGDLGSKIGTYEKEGEVKTVVEHSVNSPSLVQVKKDRDTEGPLGGRLTAAEKNAQFDTSEAPF